MDISKFQQPLNEYNNLYIQSIQVQDGKLFILPIYTQMVQYGSNIPNNIFYHTSKHTRTQEYNKPYSKSVNFLLLWISNYRQSVIVIYSLLVYSRWIKYSKCFLPLYDDISMTRTTKEISFTFSYCLNGLFQQTRVSCRKFISEPNIIVFSWLHPQFVISLWHKNKRLNYCFHQYFYWS